MSSFYRWGNWGPQRESDLWEVRQPVRGRAEARTQHSWLSFHGQVSSSLVWLLETQGVDLSERPCQVGSLKSSDCRHTGQSDGIRLLLMFWAHSLYHFPAQKRGMVFIFSLSRQSSWVSVPGAGALVAFSDDTLQSWKFDSCLSGVAGLDTCVVSWYWRVTYESKWCVQNWR